jgi:hypothetical protein
MNKSYVRSIIYILIFISALITYKFGRSLWIPILQKVHGKRTVADVIQEYGKSSRDRLMRYFLKVKVNYPPQEITLLALKKEKVLELWASDVDEYKFVHRYKIIKTSGKAGPKLREGDGQVPEGIYKIIGLNPNSSYHLSMKLNYPNDFDLQNAKKERRNEPGSNIFIHGKDVSIGCLAMGDETIEDLFVLVHDVGKSNTKVLISPTDPRTSKISTIITDGPNWLPQLYDELTKEFNKYKRKT